MKDILSFNKGKTKIVFAQQTEQEESFHQKDLVQLFPYGLSVTNDAARPLLLLKDEAHIHTLPVTISAIDAGVTLAQSDKMSLESSPHKFTGLLLESLGIEVKQAVFVEIKGSHQYLRLYMTGHPKLSSQKVRADEAMSLCLYLNIPIFATKSFIGRSRVLHTESRDVAAQSAQNFGLFDKGSGFLN